jgi:hypothetical protein
MILVKDFKLKCRAAFAALHAIDARFKTDVGNYGESMLRHWTSFVRVGIERGYVQQPV